MPQEFVDKATGQPLYAVDPAEVEAALANPARFTPIGNVNLTTPSGRSISATPDTAATVMRQGGEAQGLEAAGDAARYAAEEAKYGGSGLGAGLLGAARGLTLGLSDVVLGASEEGRETLAKLKEHNQGASLGGEILGSLSPVGPAGAVTRLAKGAAAKVAGKSVASKVLAGSAEAAIDGGLFGAGQAVSNAALGHDPLTLESLAINVGTGALFGGVIGGVIGGGIAGVGAAAGGLRKRWAAEANPLIDGRSPGTKEFGKHMGAAVKQMDEGVEATLERVTNQRAAQTIISAGDDMAASMGSAQAAKQAAKAELAEVRNAYTTARKRVVERFGDEMDVDIHALSRKPLKQALKAVQAIDDFAVAANQIRKLAGETVDEQAQLLTRMQTSATPEVAKAFEGLSKMDRRGIADTLKIDVDAVPQLGPVGEHVLKAYSLARFGDGTSAHAAVSAAEAKLAAQADFSGTGTVFSRVKQAAHAVTLLTMGRPVQALRTVLSAAGGVSLKLAEGVAKFTERVATPTAARAITRSGIAVFDQIRFSEKQNKDDGLSTPTRRIRELQDLATNPAHLDSFVDEQLAPLRAHNMDAGHEVGGMIKLRLKYYAEKAPPLAAPDPFTGFQEEISPDELGPFSRIIEAGENPLILLDELNADDVTEETVETVKTLYPSVFQKVQQMIIEQVIDRGTPLGYTQRHNLTMLMEVPLEPTDTPDTYGVLQEMHAMRKEEQQAQAGGSSGAPTPPKPTPGQRLS